MNRVLLKQQILFLCILSIALFSLGVGLGYVADAVLVERPKNVRCDLVTDKLGWAPVLVIEVDAHYLEDVHHETVQDALRCRGDFGGRFVEFTSAQIFVNRNDCSKATNKDCLKPGTK